MLLVLYCLSVFLKLINQNKITTKRHFRENIYLIGHTSYQLVGYKLPSNKEVLKVLFYNLRESARLVIDEVLIFWHKARIPTREIYHCIPKLKALYDEWRNLQKYSSRRTETQIKKENEFKKNSGDIFDIAHSNPMDMMNNELDKQFLTCQRQNGRPGVRIDRTSYRKKKNKNLQLEKIEKRKKNVAHNEIEELCEYLDIFTNIYFNIFII